MRQIDAAVIDNGIQGVDAAVREVDHEDHPVTPVQEAKVKWKGVKDKEKVADHHRDGSGRDVDVAVTDIIGDHTAAWPKMIKEVTVAKADHVVLVAVDHRAVSFVEISGEAEAAPEGPGRKTARAKEGRQAAAKRAVSNSKEASALATAKGARLGHAPPVAA